MINQNKAFTFYAFIAVLVLFPVIVWQVSMGLGAWSNGNSIVRSIGQLSGIIGACLFSLNFILAARLKFFEELVSGLPRIYVFHHLIGGTALILLVAHPLFLGLQYLPGSLPLAASFFTPSLDDIPKLLGMIAWVILVALLFITFFVRIAYQKWKATHQWLGLTLMIASLHVYLIPGSLSAVPGLRLYMITIIILGLIAYSYRVLFGRWLVRRSPYEVKAINIQDDNVTEVRLTPLKRQIRYSAGQFLFVRVHDSHMVTREPHPFSFTSSPDESYISFAAKPLGDYTRSLKQLAVGVKVDIEGPYGRFIFNRGGDKQVWIAGGIGITPFMSRIREIGNSSKGQSRIILFYVIRNKKDAVFLDELTSAAKLNNHLSLQVWESSQQGRFALNHISQIADNDGYSYFICGPEKMIEDLKGGLKKSGVKHEKIFAEEFKLY